MPLPIASAALLDMLLAAPTLAQAAGTAIVRLSDYGGKDDLTLIRLAQTTGGNAGWVSAADYPATALREGRGGEIEMAISVDAADRITSCTVTGGRPDADLREAACALTRNRVGFRHALGRDGTPRGGTVPMKMRFVPPGQPEEPLRVEVVPPPPGRSPWHNWEKMVLHGPQALFPNSKPAAWVNLSPSGKVTRCRISSSAGSDAGDLAVCKFLATKAHFEPAQDATGRGIAYDFYHVSLRVKR